MALDATAERFEEKIGWVREAAGDRFDEIELQLRTFIVAVTDDAQGLAETMAAGFPISVDQALESPMVLAGTASALADSLRERRERYGFSYIVVGADEYEAFAPVVAELAGT